MTLPATPDARPGSLPWTAVFAALVAEAVARGLKRRQVAEAIGALPKDVTRWSTTGRDWSRTAPDWATRRLAAHLGLSLLVGPSEVAIVDARLAAQVLARAGR